MINSFPRRHQKNKKNVGVYRRNVRSDPTCMANSSSLLTYPKKFMKFKTNVYKEYLIEKKNI